MATPKLSLSKFMGGVLTTRFNELLIILPGALQKRCLLILPRTHPILQLRRLRLRDSKCFAPAPAERTRPIWSGSWKGESESTWKDFPGGRNSLGQGSEAWDVVVVGSLAKTTALGEKMDAEMTGAGLQRFFCD